MPPAHKRQRGSSTTSALTGASLSARCWTGTRAYQTADAPESRGDEVARLDKSSFVADGLQTVNRLFIRLIGGRVWWARFEFTPINIEPIILRKKIEESLRAGSSLICLLVDRRGRFH